MARLLALANKIKRVNKMGDIFTKNGFYNHTAKTIFQMILIETNVSKKSRLKKKLTNFGYNFKEIIKIIN